MAGVIGWTSIPAGKNCGFTTGVTLVGFQRDWIESIKKRHLTTVFGFTTIISPAAFDQILYKIIQRSLSSPGMRIFFR